MEDAAPMFSFPTSFCFSVYPNKNLENFWNLSILKAFGGRACSPAGPTDCYATAACGDVSNSSVVKVLVILSQLQEPLFHLFRGP
jgi:hypothetical protein